MIERRINTSFLVLAVVIFYNTFRSLTLSLPDLTALIAIFTVIILTADLITNGVKATYLLILVFLALQILPILYNYTPENFSEKLIRLFGSTALFMLLGASINLNEKSVDLAGRYIIVIGTFLLFFSIYVVKMNPIGEARGGFAAPILISRSLLLYASVVFLYTIKGKIRLFQGIPLIALSVYLSISTESRGPLLAFIFSSVIGFVLNTRQSRSIQVLLAAIAAGLTAVYALPAQATERIVGVFYGKMDASSSTRLDAWSAGYAGFERHPFGNGIGSFPQENIYGLINGYSVPLDYPHNFIVEAAYEGGIIFLVFVALITIFSLFHVFKSSLLRNSWIPLVLVFTFVNSLFSSDIPGNKEMWIFIVMVIANRNRTAGNEEVQSKV